MLNLKVFAAVLLSLAVAAGGMNGEPGKLLQSAELPQLEGAVGKFTGLVPAETEPTDLEAQLRLDAESSTLEFSTRMLKARNLSEMEVKGLKLSSSTPVQLRDFQGVINVGRKSNLSGSASAVSSDSFELEGELEISESGKVEKFSSNDSEIKTLQLENVAGTVSTVSSRTKLEGENAGVTLQGFRGSMTVFPFNRTLVLSGEAEEVSAGGIDY